MTTFALNNLWTYLQGLSLSPADREWLAGKLREPSYQADPYEVSPSGDPFFADSRNIRAVERDVAEARRPGAQFFRLETREDVMQFIDSL